MNYFVSLNVLSNNTTQSELPWVCRLCTTGYLSRVTNLVSLSFASDKGITERAVFNLPSVKYLVSPSVSFTTYPEWSTWYHRACRLQPTLWSTWYNRACRLQPTQSEVLVITERAVYNLPSVKYLVSPSVPFTTYPEWSTWYHRACRLQPTQSEVLVINERAVYNRPRVKYSVSPSVPSTSCPEWSTW